MYPADPNDVLPLVETLQPELLNLGEVTHDRDHRAVVLVESLAPLQGRCCELVVVSCDAFPGFGS